MGNQQQTNKQNVRPTNVVSQKQQQNYTQNVNINTNTQIKQVVPNPNDFQICSANPTNITKNANETVTKYFILLM